MTQLKEGDRIDNAWIIETIEQINKRKFSYILRSVDGRRKLEFTSTKALIEYFTKGVKPTPEMLDYG